MFSGAALHPSAYSQGSPLGLWACADGAVRVLIIITAAGPNFYSEMPLNHGAPLNCICGTHPWHVSVLLGANCSSDQEGTCHPHSFHRHSGHSDHTTHETHVVVTLEGMDSDGS